MIPVAECVIDNQLKIPEFQEEYERERAAIMYASQAFHWIRTNRAAFKELQFACKFLHENKAPIQQGRILAELTSRGYRLTINETFSHDRNLWPVLARYLRAFHPELKQSIHLRASALDGLSLSAIPESYLIPGAINADRGITAKEWC